MSGGPASAPISMPASVRIIMPAVPPIPLEHVAEYFEQTGPAPFMDRVYAIKPGKRPLLPAVTHVDGTGRLQTVDRAHSPRFHALLTAFGALTGVPILLNTSFNESEPIVCAPREALDCFLRTRMDALVLEDCLVVRGDQFAPA